MLAILFHSLVLGQAPDHFLVERWTTQDGIPQSTITDMVIAPDRSLWLTTFGGIARFDGERFEVYTSARNPGLPSDRATAVAVTDDGVVWVGTEDHGIARIVDDECTAYGAGLGSALVMDLFVDRSGVLWIGTQEGLASLSDGVLEKEAKVPARVAAIQEAPDGTLWFAGDGLYRLEEDGPVLMVDQELACVLPLKDGTVLASGLDGSLLRLAPDGSTSTASLGSSQLRLAFDARGDVIVERSGSIFRLSGDELLPLWTQEIENGTHSVLVEEGGIWLGGIGTGLWRLRSTPLSSLDAKARSVIALREGGLLVVEREEAGSVIRHHDLAGAVHTWGARPGLVSVSRALDGVLISDVSSISRFVEGAEVERWRVDAREPMPVLQTQDGSVWTADANGSIWRLRGDETESFGRREGVLARGRPHAFLEDSTGVLWVCGIGGLGRFDGQRFEWFAAGDELLAAPIRALWEDPLGGIWGATYGSGMFRFEDGQVDQVGTAHGLREDILTQLAPDGQGNLLVMGNLGLMRMPIDALRAVADGRANWIPVEAYQDAPGLELVEGTSGFPATASSSDGRIWFVTVGGLLSYDPSLAQEISPTVDTRIDQVLVGGKRQARSGRLEIAPGENDIELRFSPATLIDPAGVPLRVRMHGLEEDWSDARGRRSMTWAELAPGDYEFQVAVSGRTAQAAVLPFTVLPTLTETWAFKAGVVIATLGALALLVAGQRLQAARRARALEERVVQRTSELAAEVVKRRHIEEELRNARDDLEMRVSERTIALAQALEKQREDEEKRYELEQQLFQTQKLESIGRLAGGVAHDFNNLLAIVLGTAEEARGRVEESSTLTPFREDMDTILAAGSRGAELIRRLLAFAREQPVQAARVDLRELLTELSPLLRRLLRKSVELELDVSSEPTHAVVDSAHVEQVLMNLVANASDAAPDQGVVKVSLDLHHQEDSEWVRLRVTDRGSGIEPELLDKVFEPFVTTKPPSKGTGLGLSTCYGLVQSMGGRIFIESRISKGTCVTVLLPLEPADRTEHAAEPLTARLLIVDDEPAISSTLRRIFEKKAGWEVITASNVSEAREACEREAVDIVLSDIVMPGESGVDLLQHLRRTHPGLPVVLMSGHASEEIRAGVNPTTRLLYKPIQSPQLLKVLREALLESRQPAAHS